MVRQRIWSGSPDPIFLTRSQIYLFSNGYWMGINFLCQHQGFRQNILRISLCAALISHLARFYFWMYQTLSFFYNWKDTTANISQVLSESETVFNCYEFLVLCNLFGCCTDSQSTSRRKIKRQKYHKHEMITDQKQEKDACKR